MHHWLSCYLDAGPQGWRQQNSSIVFGADKIFGEFISWRDERRLDLCPQIGGEVRGRNKDAGPVAHFFYRNRPLASGPVNTQGFAVLGAGMNKFYHGLGIVRRQTVSL